MEISAEVASELRKTNLSRNRYGYLAQLLVISLSLWYHTGFQTPYWPYTILIAIFGSVFRWWGSIVVQTKPILSDRLLRLGFFLFGVAWSHHFFRNFNPSVPMDEKLFILLFSIGGTIFVLQTTLVADPRSYFAFTMPIAVTILGLYGYPGTFEDWFFFLCIFIMFALTSISYFHQHRQLRDFIRARFESDKEKRRLHRLINAVPGYVSMIDRDGKYLEVNDPILNIYPNIVGTSVGELAGPSDFTDKLSAFLGSDKEEEIVETIAEFKDVTLNLLSSFKRTENGMFAVSIPINELVKARKELREKEAVAIYASKLASIGQMAASVAHEVNNPLAIIQGSAHILNTLVEEEPVDKKNLLVYTDRIISTTQRIARIVRSLRTLSRGGESDPFNPFSVRNIIKSCEDISNHRLTQLEIKLTVTESGDFTVVGREDQLGQILINLVSNSIDAISSLSDRWIRIDFGHVDGHFWLEVVDSGKGIPPEIVDKMMEPFFTTKGKEEGTGLGLSISSKILGEYGGKLTYEENRPNTTFRLSFPTPKTKAEKVKT